MKDLDRDKIDFGKGDIGKMLSRILLPTLLGMMASVVFILTDGIFVGHGVGSDGLAAINLVQPVFTVATAIGMMLGVGASVIAAIHLSRGNQKAARIIVTQAFIAVLSAGVVLGVIFYSFPDWILRTLGASDTLMPLCREYFLWFIPCILFVMIQLAAQFVIRLDGNPRFAGLVEIVPACINIVLDWLFIFPMGWGLAGAGAATSVGTSAGVIMAAFYMVRRPQTLPLYRLKRSLTSLVLTLRNFLQMAKVGISAFLGEFAISVLTLAGNYTFMKLLGEDGVAAYSVVNYLLPCIFMVYAAISQAAQPIISFNYGAGNQARVRKTLRLALLLSLGFGAAMTLLFCLFPGTTVSVFLPQGTPAYDICASGLPLYSLGFIFMAVVQTFIGYYQSVERTVPATVLTLLRGMVLPVAALMLMPSLFGVTGLWLAVPAAEAVTALCLAAYLTLHFLVTCIFMKSATNSKSASSA